MKTNLLFAAALAVTIPAAASAADLPNSNSNSFKDSPFASDGRVGSWTGFYVGLNGGGTLTDDVEVGAAESFELDSAFLLGGHVGYNYQGAGRVVVGLEGDLDKSWADYTNYLASVRGRIGVSFDRTLVYATGGVAMLGWESDTPLDTTTGWVAGVGFEHKLTSNISIGAEGLFYSFSDDYLEDEVSTDVDRELWAVRGRLSYHFGVDREPLK